MTRKMILFLSVMALFAVSAFAQNNPPQNLIAGVEEQNVQLSWQLPEDAYSTFRWDTGENSGNAVGIGDTGGTYSVAARFTSTELADFDGMDLAFVEIFPKDEATSITLQVWTGGSWNGTSGSSGTRVVNQNITNDVVWGQFNYIELDTPLTIDASEELWIGYQVADPGEGVYPCGCDDGPYDNYYGNLLYSGSWASLYDLTATAPTPLTYNWNICGFAEGDGEVVALSHHGVTRQQEHTPGTMPNLGLEACGSTGDVQHSYGPMNRALTGYKVYRDDVMIVEYSYPFALEYGDPGLAPGTYEYYVTAMYGTEESDPSNIVEAEIFAEQYNPPENLEATVNGSNVVLQWEEPGIIIDPVDDIDQGFEGSSIPGNWQNLDEDGDSYSWQAVSTGYSAHTGNFSVASASYINDVGALFPDNWLITPPINIQNGYELSFWAAGQAADYPQEHFDVLLSTTGSDPADFTETLFDETLQSIDWVEFSTDLSDWADETCYIAFVHCDVTDMFWLKLDDIYVNNATDEVVFSLNPGDDNQSSLTSYRPAVEVYNVYRSDNGGGFNFVGDTQMMYYTDLGMDNGSYEYYVTAVYVGGVESDGSNIVQAQIGNPVDDGTVPGFVNALGANNPNPFNPTTSIAYSVEQTGMVTIEIYNLRGQLVKTLVNETVTAGDHTVVWTGDDDSGNDAASGIYFYKMHSGRYTATKKMILLK